MGQISSVGSGDGVTFLLAKFAPSVRMNPFSLPPKIIVAPLSILDMTMVYSTRHSAAIDRIQSVFFFTAEGLLSSKL